MSDWALFEKSLPLKRAFHLQGNGGNRASLADIETLAFRIPNGRRPLVDEVINKKDTSILMSPYGDMDRNFDHLSPYGERTAVNAVPTYVIEVRKCYPYLCHRSP